MTVGKSIGSGTIIDGDGTILTCAHVVVDFQGFTSSSKGKVIPFVYATLLCIFLNEIILVMACSYYASKQLAIL